MSDQVTFDPLAPAALAAVQQSLAKVGHDFANLLTPLLAYPPMIKAEVADRPRLGPLLDVMERTTRDMVGISRKMLAFSLCDDFSPGPFNLDECVDMAVLEFRTHTPSGVRLEVSANACSTPIVGGRDQIQRSIEQLWRNAVESLPTGGTVRFVTGQAGVDCDTEVTTGILKPGRYARLDVTDTGPGVPRAERRKVFEPFYIGRRDGNRRRGAGLGLTHVCVVARAHGGQVDMRDVDGGFMVSLYLSLSGAVGEPA